MITEVAPPEARIERKPAIESLPHAPATPTRVEPPGRDLFLFLLLLLVVDMSSVIHIYTLSQLYSPQVFAGMGTFLVLIALLLLILPRTGRPEWLRLPFRSPWSVAGLYASVCLAAAGVTMLLLALFNPPEWYPWDPNVPRDPTEPLWGLAALFAAIVIVPLLAGAIAYARNELLRRALLSLILCGWLLLSYVNLQLMLGVGVGWAPRTWAAVLSADGSWLIFAGGLALALVLTFAGPRGFMLIALVAGLALRLSGMQAIPISAAGGDMLPLVQLATGRIISGQEPYIVYQLPWDLPLTYWPLTVLTYTPFAALNIDLRLANLLLGPVLVALLWQAAKIRSAACYAFGLLYLAPAMLQWDLTTAAPPYWLWLAVALAAVAARTPLPGATLGWALAAAPLAAPFAPFLGARWLQEGARKAAINVAAALACFLLVVGPFLLLNSPGFWAGAISWFNDVEQLPRLKWTTDRTWLLEPGLAGQFWLNGWESWLKPLQVVLVGGLALFALLRVRLTPEAALRWGTAAYLLFMVFNPVIWPYLYIPPLIAMVVLLSKSER